MRLRLLAILITITIIPFSLIAQQVTWGELPEPFLLATNVLATDHDETTYVDLEGEDLVLTADSVRIENLLQMRLVMAGTVLVTARSGMSDLSSQIMEHDGIGLALIDLSDIDPAQYETLELQVTRPSGTTDISIIYECSLFGQWDNTPLTMDSVTAIDNELDFNLTALSDGAVHSADFTFTPDTSGMVEGKLTLFDTMGNAFEYKVVIPKTGSKTISFEYLPGDGFSMHVMFNPVRGSLESATVYTGYETGDDDVRYLAGISDGTGAFTAWNGIDNEMATEIHGDWDSGRVEIIEAHLSEPTAQVNLSFYWIPGFSDTIRFEAVYEDGTYGILGSMSDNTVAFNDGGWTRKEQFESLRTPGWKLFVTPVQDKRITAIRIYEEAAGTAGGITELKVFGSDLTEGSLALVAPNGYTGVSRNSRVYWYDRVSGMLESRYPLQAGRVRMDSTPGKIGYISRIDDVAQVRRYDIGTQSWFLPFTDNVDSGITIDFGPNNVFNTRSVHLTGNSPYPVTLVEINGASVTKDLVKGYGNFTKDISYASDGLHFIRSTIGGDFNLRDRIDPVYIDTAAPGIHVDYPKTTYVKSVNSPIRGYLYDLTPSHVQINGVSCIMNGRWYTLGDATVDAVDKEYHIEAWDLAGHYAEAYIYLTVDNVAPILSISSPADNSSHNVTNINITGTVTEDTVTTVYCRGKKATVTAGGGAFTLNDVPLEPGINLVSIVAVDEAENETEIVIRLDVDLTAPRIPGLESPYYDNDSSFTFEVTVEDEFPASLYYGLNPATSSTAMLSSGTQLDDDHWIGTFQVTQALSSDSTTLYLKAIDGAGNETLESVQIIRDLDGPLLTVTSPEDGYRTGFDTVNFNGTYNEPYLDTIEVNGLAASWGGGTFSYPAFQLTEEGTNDITVVARDLAGNASSVNLTVFRDTLPPQSPTVRVSSNDATIDVHWYVDDEGDVEYYQVKRVPSFSGQDTIETTETRLLDDDGIDYNLHLFYHYYIRSVDAMGNKSDWMSGSNGSQRSFAPDTTGDVTYGAMRIEWDGDELDHPVEVKVHAVQSEQVLDNGALYSQVYNFSPHNLLFRDPMEISVEIDRETWERDKVKWFYFDEQSQKWYPVYSWYDDNSGRVVGMIQHFSPYAAKQDMTREFVDTDLSALKSTREDTNVHVVESSGTVTFSENELTLKGPGEYDFTLRRSLNSDDLAGATFSFFNPHPELYYYNANSPPYKNVHFYSTQVNYRGYPEYVNQNVFVTTPGHNHNRALHMGWWQWNMPFMRGNTITLEDGSAINLTDFLQINGHYDYRNDQYIEIDVSDKIYGPLNAELQAYADKCNSVSKTVGNEFDYFEVEITVTTLDGKRYIFRMPSYLMYKMSGAEYPITNSPGYYTHQQLIFDDRLAYHHDFMAIANRVEYPDGSILYFGDQEDREYYDIENFYGKFDIFWNGDRSNAIVINPPHSFVENLVTGDKVDYDLETHIRKNIKWIPDTYTPPPPDRGVSRSATRSGSIPDWPMTAEEINENYITWNIDYIKKATYTKKNHGQDEYVIEYDTNAFAETNLNLTQNWFVEDTHAPPVYTFNIQYPDGKKREYNFQRWYSSPRGAICYGLMRQCAYLFESNLFMPGETADTYDKIMKREYQYESSRYTPLSYNTTVDVNTFGFDGGEKDLVKSVRKSFNPVGKLILEKDESKETAITYKGFDGFAKFDGSSGTIYNYDRNNAVYETIPVDGSGSGACSGVEFSISSSGGSTEVDPISGLTVSNEKRYYTIRLEYDGTVATVGYSTDDQRVMKVPDKFPIRSRSLNDVGITVTPATGDKYYFRYDYQSNTYNSKIDVPFYKKFKQNVTENTDIVPMNNSHFELYRDDDGTIIYGSIAPRITASYKGPVIYLYVYKHGINKNRITGTQTRVLDTQQRLSDPSWTKFEHDEYGRQTDTWDNLGNYRNVMYEDHPVSRMKPAEERTYLLNNPGSDGTDDSSLKSRVVYGYGPFNPHGTTEWLRLSYKTVYDSAGSVIKGETYDYYDSGDLHKLREIRAKAVDGGSFTGTDKNTIEFVYDDGKKDNPLREVTINAPDGDDLFKRTYAYRQGDGLMAWSRDAYDKQTTFGYDFLGRNNRISFNNGAEVRYTFDDTWTDDEMAWYERAIYPDAASATSGTGMLQKEKLTYFNNKIYRADYFTGTDTSIRQSFEWDAANRKVSSSDFKGNEYRFEYERGFLHKVIKPEVDSETIESRVQYRIVDIGDRKYYRITRTDEENIESRELKDQWGRTVWSGGLLNGNWSGKYVEYNYLSKPVKEYAGAILNDSGFDLSGAYLTEYEYDDLGRTKRKIARDVELDRDGTRESVIEEYEYDEFDFLVAKYAYPEGDDRETWPHQAFEYDGAGNQVKIHDIPGDGTGPFTTEVTYDRNGNVVEVTYPPFDTDTTTGHRIKQWYVYDNMGRVTQSISNPGLDDNARVTFITYDEMGRQKGTYDMRAALTNGDGSYAMVNEDTLYDRTGYCDAFPGGRMIYQLNDASADDFGSEVQYDMLGRVVRVDYAKDLYETAEYDENGNLIEVTNKLGGKTFYRYDVLNRPILTKSGDSLTFQAYYKNGLKKAFVLPRAIDEGTRTTDISEPGGAGEQGVLAALRSQAGDPASTVRYAYNEAGMLETGTDCYDNYVEYTYTTLGQVRTKRLKTGAVQELSYYHGGLTKATALTDGGRTIQKQRTDYDWRGNRVAYYTGDESEQGKSEPVKRFYYNRRGLLERVLDTYGNERTITYNDLGMAEETAYPDGRTETITYNDDGQPTESGITAGTLSYQRSFEYDRISGAVRRATIEQYDGAILTDSLQEDFTYDLWSTVSEYGISASGSYDRDDGPAAYGFAYGNRYQKEISDGTMTEYLSYPGRPDRYVRYERDEYARLDFIGRTRATAATAFDYEVGSISGISFSNGEEQQFEYDLFGRITKESATVGGAETYTLENWYENQTGNRTGNVRLQRITSGGASREFTYEYDRAARIDSYRFDGIEAVAELNGYEEQRCLYRNDYMINGDVDMDNYWLLRDDAKVDGGELHGYESAVTVSAVQLTDDTTEYRIDRDHSSVEVIFNAPGAEGARWISILADERAESASRYTLYVKPDGAGQYELLSDDQYDVRHERGRDIFTLVNAMTLASLKVVFHYRDEIDPIPFGIDMDSTADIGTNRLATGYKEETEGGLRARLADVIQVYGIVRSYEGEMGFDTADRRTSLREAPGGLDARDFDDAEIDFDNGDNEDRIRRQGDSYFRYDNAGRRTVSSSKKGTYVYRYNLDGRLTRVYYSNRRHDVDDPLFDMLNLITGDLDYDTNGFDLIEVNRYNISGIRIYKWSRKEESVYYQTPFGYLGKKDITTGETRYLVNYINSQGAATYSFESAQGSYDQNEGAVYSSKMNLYNGSQHGVERAAMNNSVPVTVDFQPLFETLFGNDQSIDTAIETYGFNGSQTYSWVKVITALEQTDMLIYHRDQLGSVRAVTAVDDLGDQVTTWQGDYKPFGELLTNSFTNDWLPLKTFALHEHDLETGLIYAQQRWLDYETGQFISEDPIMDGLNWYAYAGGSPMGNVDPTGLKIGQPIWQGHWQWNPNNMFVASSLGDTPDEVLEKNYDYNEPKRTQFNNKKNEYLDYLHSVGLQSSTIHAISSSMQYENKTILTHRSIQGAGCKLFALTHIANGIMGGRINESSGVNGIVQMNNKIKSMGKFKYKVDGHWKSGGSSLLRGDSADVISEVTGHNISSSFMKVKRNGNGVTNKSDVKTFLRNIQRSEKDVYTMFEVMSNVGRHWVVLESVEEPYTATYERGQLKSRVIIYNVLNSNDPASSMNDGFNRESYLESELLSDSVQKHSLRSIETYTDNGSSNNNDYSTSSESGDENSDNDSDTWDINN
jgi:RHS repeat-associated protein